MANMMGTAVIPICKHIKDDGIPCGSPALRGRTLCYHHDLLYRRHRTPKNAGCNLVPVLKNHRDIGVAVTNILRARRDGILSEPDATAMLYGMQIARSLLPVPRGRRPRQGTKRLTD